MKSQQNRIELVTRPAVEKGQIEASNSRSLYRHVESFLKECLVTANLKESSSNSHQAELVSSQSSRLSVELPFVSKYLLIAAYLASYNPVSSGVTPLFFCQSIDQNDDCFISFVSG